jgi:hypothetical protein
MKRIKRHQPEEKISKPGTKKVFISPFPRPVCLEKCTMETPKGYEADILMTLKAFI